MNLRRVFERCHKHRIIFYTQKSKIGLNRIDWVGQQLDAEGIHFSDEQLSEVARFPTPVGAKSLRSFFSRPCPALRGHGETAAVSVDAGG